MVKLLFVLEVFAAARSYINAHIKETVTVREADRPWNGSLDSDVYGIGIGTGDKTVFWFHSRTEAPDPGEESDKE